MKKKCLFLFSLLCIGVAATACLDDETSKITQESYPLMAFSVGVENAATGAVTYYHGDIDQTEHKVNIGSITNLYSITDVDYTLEEGATISPDPSAWIGNWKKDQTVTVTGADGATTSYVITFTQYDESMDNVLFYDDFSGSDRIPDDSKWSLCARQTSDWNEEMSESYDQAYVDTETGELVLRAEQIDGEYQSGGIETQNKFAFTFGKVEVRAKIVRYPDGAFPAIWMMPQTFIYAGWPACGEIDIMEHIKQDGFIYSSIHNHYYDTMGNDDPSHTATVACDIEEYHVYGVEWTEDELVFTLDGQETFIYPNLHLENEAEMMQWPFTADASFYLILNMGLGSNTSSGSWAGPIDDAGLPAEMRVDWVKVTRLDD